MNISAILVTTKPENTDNMIETLNQISGIEVYHHEHATGKIIVIQEAETIQQEVDGLKNIKKLPGIILAEMVEHYFGDDTNLYPDSELSKMEATCGIPGGDSCIPDYLNQ